MTVELKPCPFCGGTNLKSGGDDKIVGTWCLTCEAAGPNQYGKYDWNRRADTIASLTARNAALEAENAGLRLAVRQSPSMRHFQILVEAMAEVKATSEGLSDQPIANIVSGCLSEIAALASQPDAPVDIAEERARIAESHIQGEGAAAEIRARFGRPA